MKIIGYSIIVAMICVIMASVASAGYDVAIGGATSLAQGGSGTGNIEQHFVFDDSVANTPVLWTRAAVLGTVAPGATGTVAASFDTQTKKTKSEGTIATNGYNLNVGIDGKVAINIAKTSTEGSASALSALYAESKVDIADDEAEGYAEAGAQIFLDGTGTASATTTARDLTYETWLSSTGPGPVPDLHAPGYVKGTVALTAQNSRGGTVQGQARIRSWGEAENGATGRYAQAEVCEEFEIQSTMGISFDGLSRITAAINGEEFSEPVVYIPRSTTVAEIADIEATSKLSGVAIAQKRNDAAYAAGRFVCAADSGGFGVTVPGVYATELTELAAWSNRLVADPDPAHAVRALSLLEEAEWSAAAADMATVVGTAPATAFQKIPGPIGFEGYQASVSGQTGFTENGDTILLPGSGAGAASTGAHTVWATLVQEQEAQIDADGDKGLHTVVEAQLSGPQFSGFDTGGAGVYCGVLNQNLFITGPLNGGSSNNNGLFPIFSNQLTAIETIYDENMIVWVNGGLLVPGGHQSFDKPIFSITPIGLGIGAESGPTTWYWQAAGSGGAFFLYESGVFFP